MNNVQFVNSIQFANSLTNDAARAAAYSEIAERIEETSEMAEVSHRWFVVLLCEADWDNE